MADSYYDAYFNEYLQKYAPMEYIRKPHTRRALGDDVWNDAHKYAERKLNRRKGALSQQDRQRLAAGSNRAMHNLLDDKEWAKEQGLQNLFGDGKNGGEASKPLVNWWAPGSSKGQQNTTSGSSPDNQISDGSSEGGTQPENTDDPEEDIDEEGGGGSEGAPEEDDTDPNQLANPNVPQNDEAGTTLPEDSSEKPEEEGVDPEAQGEPPIGTGTAAAPPEKSKLGLNRIEGGHDLSNSPKTENVDKAASNLKKGKELAENAIKKKAESEIKKKAAQGLFTFLAANPELIPLVILAVIVVAFGMLLLLMAVAAANPGSPSQLFNNTGTKSAIVCLDPGHPPKGAGGEPEINLKVAKEVKTELESRGYTIIMTRTNDSAVSISDRPKKCIEGKATFMYSFHADGTPRTAGYPYQIYMKSSRSLASKSKSFASQIQDEVAKQVNGVGGLKDGGTCAEGSCTAVHNLGIFTGADDGGMPAVLTEMVQMRSGNSALDNDATRRKLVIGIANGIAKVVPLTSKSSGGSTNTSIMNKVPQFFQGSSPWGSKIYGCGTTYAAAGCGPTSIAMVVSYFTGKNHYPDEIGSYAYAHGMRVCSGGTSWSAPIKIPEHYGLNAKLIANSDSAIKKYLGKGAIIIQLHHHDFFTRGGHFIVVTGVRSDGKYTVNDPNHGNYPRTKVATKSQILGGTDLMTWAVWK